MTSTSNRLRPTRRRRARRRTSRTCASVWGGSGLIHVVAHQEVDFAPLHSPETVPGRWPRPSQAVAIWDRRLGSSCNRDPCLMDSHRIPPARSRAEADSPHSRTRGAVLARRSLSPSSVSIIGGRTTESRPDLDPKPPEGTCFSRSARQAPMPPCGRTEQRQSHDHPRGLGDAQHRDARVRRDVQCGASARNIQGIDLTGRVRRRSGPGGWHGRLRDGGDAWAWAMFANWSCWRICAIFGCTLSKSAGFWSLPTDVAGQGIVFQLAVGDPEL